MSKTETREGLLSTVRIHGELGRLFGEEHRVAVRSIVEVFSAVNGRRPGFIAHLVRSETRGGAHIVKVNGEEITPGNVHAMVRRDSYGKSYDIVPSPSGAGIEIGVILGTTIPIIGITVGQAIVLAIVLAAGIYAALSQPKAAKGIDEEDATPGDAFSGALNLLRPGHTLPVLYGEYLTGSIVASAGIRNGDIDNSFPGSEWPLDSGYLPQTSISTGGLTVSKDQIARILDAICEGEIEGFPNSPEEDVYIEEVPASEARKFHHEYTLGTSDQGALGKWATSESLTSVGVQLKKDASVVRTTASSNSLSAIRVNLAVLALSQQGTNSAARDDLKYVIEVEDLGTPKMPTVNVVRNHDLRIISRRNFAEEIPVNGTGPYQVTVTKGSRDSTTTSQSTVMWDSFVEVGTYKLSYPNTVLQGVEFSASEFPSIPSRNYLLRGMKVRVPSNYDPTTRIYTGDWDGTFKADRAFTSNPSWCLLDLILDSRYGMGEYLAESDCELWSFYRAAVRSDTLVNDGLGGTEPLYELNAYLHRQEEAVNLISQIAAVMESRVYWNGSQLAIAQDRPDIAVYEFTEANVENGIFQYIDAPLRGRTNSVVVKWSDPEDFYSEKVERVENRDSIAKYGVRAKSIIGLGITSRSGARRLGISILEAELMGDSVRFSTGLEGIGVQPGDVIRVIDPYRNTTVVGGRTTAIGASSFTIDSDWEPGAGAHLASVVLDDQDEALSASGNTVVLTLAEDPANDDYRLVQVWEDADDDGVFELSREPIGYDNGTKVLSLAPIAGLPAGSRDYEVRYMTGLHQSNVASHAAGPPTQINVDDAFDTQPTAGGVWSVTKENSLPTEYRVVSRSQKTSAKHEIMAVPYDAGRYQRVIDMVDVDEPNDIIPPWLQGNPPPKPVGLMLTVEVRRDSGQVFPAVVVTWAEPASNIENAETIAGYRVTWTFGGDSFTTELIRGNEYVIPAREVGTYSVAVASEQVFTHRLSGSLLDVITVSNDTVPELGMRISGLKISGRNDLNWIGRDVSLEWRINFDGAPELGYVGEQSDGFVSSTLFSGYIVQVVDGMTGEQIGDDYGGFRNASFAFPFDINAQSDGGPHRQLIIRVAGVDSLGRVSSWESIHVQNSAPLLPALVATQETGTAILLRFSTEAADPDFRGFIVWLSESQSFTPGASNVAFKGFVEGDVRVPVEAAKTYYFRYAAYDEFSSEPDDLNVSPEVEITTTTIVDPQAIVDAANIGPLQIDSVDWDQITDAQSLIDAATIGPSQIDSIDWDQVSDAQQLVDSTIINNAIIVSLAADKLTGFQAAFNSLTVASAQIISLAAAKITGLQATFDTLTVSGAQIDSLDANKLTSFQAAFNALTVAGAQIDELAANKLTGGQAWFDTLTVAGAQIDELSASKIVGGNLDADVITVNSLRAEHSVFGSGDNLISDPGFEILELDEFETYTDFGSPAGSWSFETTTTRSGARSLKYEFGTSPAINPGARLNAPSSSLPFGHAPAAENDQFYMEVFTRHLSGTAPSASPTVARIGFHNSAGSEIGSAVGANYGGTSTWDRAVVVGTAPVNTMYVTFGFQIDKLLVSAGTTLLFDSAYARRMVTTGVAEIGSMTEIQSDYVDHYDNGVSPSTSWYEVFSSAFTATGDGTTVIQFTGLVHSAGGGTTAYIRIVREPPTGPDEELAEIKQSANGSAWNRFHFLKAIPFDTGTSTYRVEIRGTGSGHAECNDVTLIMSEVKR